MGVVILELFFLREVSLNVQRSQGFAKAAVTGASVHNIVDPCFVFTLI